MPRITLKKAFKEHLRGTLIIIGIIIGLFFGYLDVFGAVIYSENFDPPDWVLDEPVEKYGWDCDITGVENYCKIANDEFTSTPHSAKLHSEDFSISYWHNITEQTATYIEFWFKNYPIDIPPPADFWNYTIWVYGKNATTGQEEIIVYLVGKPYDITGGEDYSQTLHYTLNGVDHFYITEVFEPLPATMNYLKIDVNENNDRWQVQVNKEGVNVVITDWLENFSEFDFDYLTKIVIFTGENTFWIDDFSLGIAEYWECLEGITNFDTYYLENSEYTEPIGLIRTLASTSKPAMETIGDFLCDFAGIFNLASATAKGNLFGSAIPQVRGYLDIVNDFFGGLPIGEGLLVFIVVIILIAVFKIVIRIIHLIKP